MRERDIEEYLVRKIKLIGGFASKFTSPAKRSVPDRIIVFNGIVFFIEVKAPNKRPTPAQQHEHEKFRKHGAVVLVIDSKIKVLSLCSILLDITNNKRKLSSAKELERLCSLTWGLEKQSSPSRTSSALSKKRKSRKASLLSLL